mgnify:FL=1
MQNDVRLISATNLSVNQLLDGNKFRLDLLYRINTVEIQVPSLRERKEDIPELIDFFKSQYGEKYGLPDIQIHQDVLKRATEYNWPGNVRELQHAVERAVLMSTGSKIQASDLVPRRVKNKTSESDLDLNLDRMEKKLIEEALQIHQGNMTRASKELGLTRAALYRRLEKYGL